MSDQNPVAPAAPVVPAAEPAKDALMSELQGSVKSSQIDALTPGTKVDPLLVRPSAPATAVTQADVLHSIKKGGKGFDIDVVGEYYAPSKEFPGKKVKKPYKVTVALPSLDSAMSVIKNHLIKPTVFAKHPEATGVRTFKIVDTRPRSADTPKSQHLQFMNFEDLKAFAVDRKIPIDLAAYPQAEVLRETVIDFIQNPTDFTEREAKKQVKRKAAAELADMNPGIVPEL